MRRRSTHPACERQLAALSLCRMMISRTFSNWCARMFRSKLWLDSAKLPGIAIGLNSTMLPDCKGHSQDRGHVVGKRGCAVAATPATVVASGKTMYRRGPRALRKVVVRSLNQLIVTFDRLAGCSDVEPTAEVEHVGRVDAKIRDRMRERRVSKELPDRFVVVRLVIDQDGLGAS